MIFRLFARRQSPATASRQIYDGVVAQSRRAELYRDLAVPDTPVGRFDMICLHLIVLSKRLAASQAAGARALDQDIFDLFTDDIDRALRQIGIGDTAVPKRKKRLIHRYFGHVAALDLPLGQVDRTALETALAGRVYDGADCRQSAALAGYLLRAAERLRTRACDDLLSVGPDWPPVVEPHPVRP